VEHACCGHAARAAAGLSLDGELTEQQRETYFALLEPQENTG